MLSFCARNLRRFLTILMLAAVATAANAIPAKPGLTRTLTLTDGTTVVAKLVGDEFCHYWRGSGGQAYRPVEGTDLYQPFDVEPLRSKARQRRTLVNERRTRRLAPRRVGSLGNYTGQKKGLVILVNFSTTKFQDANDNAFFQRVANEKNFSEGKFVGSVYDYFYAQSRGQFELTFDVVGPVSVSSPASYYGANDSDGNDKRPATMVIEALKAVNAEVNFADYDWDGDGEVDQVYVIYAGQGEADGGASSTIWPHEWRLSDARSYGDGSGAQRMDGVKIDTYACGPELSAEEDEAAGIGTMCHEFSHCLGYPDFYDTDYSNGQGMFRWDLMDTGSYNGDGYIPAGYTSYERWMAGWLTPIELTSSTEVNNQKALTEGGEAYIIYNKGHRDEYFMLENRQQKGWDADIPGCGLLILHVDYDASAWYSNTPNDDPAHQRMTWIPADNEYQYTIYEGARYYTIDGAKNDTYPNGTVNAFNKNSTPSAKFNNQNSNGSYYLDASVEAITQNGDGTVSFRFVGSEDYKPLPVIVADEVLSFATTVGQAQTLTFDVLSEDLRGDITLTLSDASGCFALGTTTIAQTEAETTISVTFTPAVAGTFAATVTLSSEGADDVTVALSGKATDGSAVGQALLYEGLSGYDSKGDGTQALTSDYDHLDYSGWTLTKIFSGGTTNAYGNGGCLKFGSGSAKGVLESGEITLIGDAVLTFYLKRYGSDTGKLNVEVTGATADVTQFTPSAEWTLCTVSLTGATGAVTIKLSTSSKRAYVDEINLVAVPAAVPSIALLNNSDNSGVITTHSGSTVDATLSGRIFYRDGSWNTLCLPFDLSGFDGTPLADAEVKELDIENSYEGHQTGLAADGTLYLFFKDATVIEAGKPYLVRWAADGQPDITDPTFSGVQIGSAAPLTIVSADDKVSFVGIYAPAVLQPDTWANLYLGSNNTLKYPKTAGYSLKAFRAYFALDLAGMTGVKGCVLRFDGTADADVINALPVGAAMMPQGSIYNLSGQQLTKLQRGINIVNGKKVVVR